MMTLTRQIAATLIAVMGMTVTATAQDSDADRMAREHRNDAPVANPASEAAPRVPVTGEEVSYATIGGTAVKGYLARPAKGGEGLPGLIVIHEWWGLNDNVRAMTRRLAGEGYAALAVDLYGGRAADTPEAARELMMAANNQADQTLDNIRQAYGYLENTARAHKVASIGWCFGGGWSLRTALALPDKLAAAVIYYGSLVTDPQELATLQMPILAIFGGQDRSIPLVDVRVFEATLKGLGKNVTVIVYPDANHAFANPSGRNYDPKAAEEAWQETVRFLADSLQKPLR